MSDPRGCKQLLSGPRTHGWGAGEGGWGDLGWGWRQCWHGNGETQASLLRFAMRLRFCCPVFLYECFQGKLYQWLERWVVEFLNWSFLLLIFFYLVLGGIKVLKLYFCLNCLLRGEYALLQCFTFGIKLAANWSYVSPKIIYFTKREGLGHISFLFLILQASL